MIIGELLDAYRWKHKLGMRELARKIGISPATLLRIEHGKDCDIRSLMLVINWIMQ